MRELYNKYFFVPEEGKGKISERVLFARIAVTVLLVILGLAQMGLGAVAHFLGTYEMGTPYIVTAYYDLDCTITADGVSATGKTVTAADASAYPRTYEIKLDLDSENTASTGFCRVEVYYQSTAQTLREGEVPTPDYVYYTAQLGEDEAAQGGVRTTLSFDIKLNEPATVKLVPNWGVSTYYGFDVENEELFIEQGDSIIPPPPPVVEEEEDTSTDNTTDNTDDTDSTDNTENAPADTTDKKEPGAYEFGESADDESSDTDSVTE